MIDNIIKDAQEIIDNTEWIVDYRGIPGAAHVFARQQAKRVLILAGRIKKTCEESCGGMSHSAGCEGCGPLESINEASKV